MDLLLLCLLYGVYRLIVEVRKRRPGQEPAVPVAVPTTAAPVAVEVNPAPTAGELLSISDWAFDYERALIGTAGSVADREERLHVVSRLIVPLVGHLRLCDVDDELVRSVRRGLIAQLEGERGGRASRICTHFIAWARYYAAPPTRRKTWQLWDPDAFHVNDEFTEG